MEEAKRTAFKLIAPLFEALKEKKQANTEALLADLLARVEHYGKEVRRNQIDARHTTKKHVDAALAKVREALAEVLAASGGALATLTEAQLVAVWQGMPGGADGWLKEFGFVQFGQAVLKAARAVARGEAVQPAATAG